jgi:hypothetical protein
MNTLFSGTSSDPVLESVAARIEECAAPDPAATFGDAIRRSIDEVLDGPRTGRWGFEQLEKTEKTYVGTKLEIVLRTALDLEPGPTLDLEIYGNAVDVKWAMNSSWQIPIEAVGEICLCVGGRQDLSRFQVGVVRCDEVHLNRGSNRDKKRTISKRGRAAMRMLVNDAAIPPNFVADMDGDLRERVMSEPTIQRRVTRIFQELPYEPIPRGAIATIARTTGDPMRRLRADSGADDPLRGMRILSAKYGNKVVTALGHKPLRKDEFMSVPQAEIESLPVDARMSLPSTVRRRFGLD